MKVYDIPFSELLGRETGPYKAFYRPEPRASYMTAYIPDAWCPEGGKVLDFNRKRPAVVLFPGGGYHLSYEGEGEPVALQFCAAGACVFEVRYSVVDLTDLRGEPLFPQPLEEALTAVRYVRGHAEEFGIDPHNIAVMGFSAGGHVAGMAGTLWNKPCAAPFEEGPAEAYRPDKMILCYPVLSSGKFAHRESFRFLMGDEASGEELESVSIELQADAQTPPAFLWHCEDDGCVPCENSRMMKAKLDALGIPCELHLYPRGGHGGSLGTYLTGDDHEVPSGYAGWIRDAIRFLFDHNPCLGE